MDHKLARNDNENWPDVDTSSFSSPEYKDESLPTYILVPMPDVELDTATDPRTIYYGPYYSFVEVDTAGYPFLTDYERYMLDVEPDTTSDLFEIFDPSPIYYGLSMLDYESDYDDILHAG